MNLSKQINPLDRVTNAHRVNPAKPISFKFDGKTYVGCEGDTLASALLANDVTVVGRSFKLHRPRGLMSAGIEESNALIQLESGSGYDEPNARATLIPLYEGLNAKGQNSWPNVNRDVFSVLSLFHRMFPASFYYKSMMWPSWHFYEGLVRKMAGLGKLPELPDKQHYEKQNIHCDVLICGGGASGLAAALALAHTDKKVLLVDAQEEFGGSLLGENRSIGSQSGLEWVENTLSQLQAAPNVTMLSRTMISGYYDQNFLVGSQRVTNHLGRSNENKKIRERLLRIRAEHVVLATGAIERPLVFPNNDRPGIMLASGVQCYLNRYGVKAGQRAVVVCNNDNAYRVAFDMANAGVDVAALIDTRGSVNGPFQSKIKEMGIPLYAGTMIRKVHGRRKVKAVSIAAHNGDGHLGKTIKTIECDLVAMSAGWTPTIHLYSQAGGQLSFNDELKCFVPNRCDQNISVIGAANGRFHLEECLTDGLHVVPKTLGTTVNPELNISACDEFAEEPSEAYWYTKNENSEKQWLDFQYDVKVSDIELANRENFLSIEHVKRFTTNGMSVDQGKTSNVNALAVMAELCGKKIEQVGTTKFRPPYHPVTIGAFAGRDIRENYSPRLEMPAHQWHVANGAHMEDMGGWQRPEYYLQSGETEEDAIRREVLAVRHSVGMFDGSPLGKIEVKGPDAAAFLNRIYVNNVESLKTGFARYGLMCNENGVVMDDGVFVRLSDDHFLLHTTSSGASRISLWMEEWLQCEWPNLQVVICNATTQWANVTVSGPKARDVVALLASDIDFSRESFPHMQVRIGTVNGVDARVLRASFTGEISYEISVPARYGQGLWEAIYKAGEAYGITPYGIESLLVLRTEKGYLHIGVDTDGTTNPLDLGWGRAIAKKEVDFIGRRSLSRPNDTRDDRFQFVGIEVVNSSDSLPVGGHFVNSANPIIPVKTMGYVTSSYYSPNLDKCIGLGLVEGASARAGEETFVYSNGKTIAVKLVQPSHFDSKGERLNG
nr:sarcosine oxidase subunit alpha family protein [uncultured Amphritea sp.]